MKRIMFEKKPTVPPSEPCSMRIPKDARRLTDAVCIRASAIHGFYPSIDGLTIIWEDKTQFTIPMTKQCAEENTYFLVLELDPKNDGFVIIKTI